MKFFLSLKFSYGLKRTNNRNCFGHKTFFHRAGGYKKRCKYVDFFYILFNMPAIVRTIELDNSRTAAIALISYYNEILSYIIAVNTLKVGQIIYITQSNFNKFIGFKTGDISQLNKIKTFNNISIIANDFIKNKGAQYARAYGTSVHILKILNNISLLKLPSTEVKFFTSNQRVTHGIITKIFNLNNNSRLKAGKLRTLGYKSNVRKCAMNPVDHPHGGNTSSKAVGLNYYGQFYKHKKNKKFTIKLFKFFIF